ncbi:MAG: CBS domain-containing protein [Candidatus Eremiobacterota bacterium]
MALSWLSSEFALESFEPAYPEPAQAWSPLSRVSQVMPPVYRSVARLADIMSAEVVTIDPDTGLDEALLLMKERGFRHLPVVSQGRLQGVLSDRDVLRTVRQGKLSETPVARAMTRRLWTAGPEMPIWEAASLMAEHRIGCLPVVDPGTGLVGIVTTTDMMRCLAFHAPVEAWL